MKCPKCQTVNFEGVDFCKGYGQPLRIGLVCPHYEQTNSADSEFCIECGHRLTGEVTAATSIQSLEPKNFALDRLTWLDQETTRYRDYEWKATSFHAAFFTVLLYRLLDAQRRILLSC